MQELRAEGDKMYAARVVVSRLFNRRVDLHTPASLSRYFRDRVLAEAEDQFVAA